MSCARCLTQLFAVLPTTPAWLQGGYAVEVAEGLVLAALGSPTAALHWATATIEACLEAAWPQELLEHQLGAWRGGLGLGVGLGLAPMRGNGPRSCLSTSWVRGMGA